MSSQPFDTMIFAAGLGTRLKPLTDNKPKALVEVNGKPLLKHILDKLKQYDVQRIVINVHHFSEQIIQYLTDNNLFDLNIHFSDESKKLLDTGGGLKKAQKLFPGDYPILVYNADILSNINLNNLVNEHLKTNALITLLVRKRKTNRYFLFDSNKQLCGWTNTKTGKVIMSRLKKNTNKLAFSGIHVIKPNLFSYFTESGKFSIINTYLKISAQETVLGYIDDADYWMGVGTTEELLKAEKFLSNNS